MGINFEYYYSMLYSIYSFLNIILPILGGLLMVMCGIRLSFVVFGLAICVGQLIFTLGSQYNSMLTMIGGRAIFSIGGENLQISQTALICYWFYKSEVALPLGLSITISRLGSSINDVASPRIAHENNATPAYWVGFLLSFLSLLTIGVLCILDAAKKEEINPNSQEISSDIVFGVELNSWDDFKKNISEFKLLYWLITVVCLLTYGTVLPFNFIIVNYLTTTHFKEMQTTEARHKAGIYMAIPFFIGALIIPVFGFIIDKYGKRAYLTLVSALLTSIVFLLFFFCDPLFPLILIGITYSMFAAVIWPSISLIISKPLLGFAYGITTSFQQFGTAVNPIIVAAMFVHTRNYNLALGFFSVLGFTAVLFSIWLIKENGNCNCKSIIIYFD